MLALQVAVRELLATDQVIGPLLHFFVAPLNFHPPYVEYWTGNGIPDDMAGFGEEAREYDIFIQSTSRDGIEAMNLYERAENLLKYKVLDVEGWNQRSKVQWLHELDDPGDATQDDEMIYYAGGVFRVALYRQRAD